MARRVGTAAWTARGRVLLPGTAEGRAIVLGEPLSLWGGLDVATGRIADVHHPQHGESLVGRVLVMPSGRGSSSSSTVLAEALRRGTGPRGVLLAAADEIIVLGALVAELLYGRNCPVLALAVTAYRRVQTGDELLIGKAGAVTVRPAAGLT